MSKYRDLKPDDYDSGLIYSIDFTCIRDHRTRIRRLEKDYISRSIQFRRMPKNLPNYIELKEALVTAVDVLDMWKNVLYTCSEIPKVGKRQCSKHIGCYVIDVSDLTECDPLVDDDDEEECISFPSSDDEEDGGGGLEWNKRVDKPDLDNDE